VAESEITLAAYEEEEERLFVEGEAAQTDFDRARGEADLARAAVATAEIEARAAADALAQVRARRAQAQRSAQDAAGRIARLGQEIASVEQEARTVAASLDADETLSLKRAGLETAQAAAAEAEELAMSAEEATARCAGPSSTPPGRASPKSKRRVDPALSPKPPRWAKMLNVGASLWPAIVDELKVAARL
jgi:chromosome segregation protein